MGHITDEELNRTIAARAGLPFEDYERIRRKHEVPNKQLIDYVRIALRPRLGVHVISNAARGAVVDRLGGHTNLFHSITESASVGC